MEELRDLSEPEDVIAGGQIERIGKPEAQLTWFHGAFGVTQHRHIDTNSVSEATSEIIRQLTMPLGGDQQPVAIEAVGHRIVHGGTRFIEPVFVDDVVLNHLRELTELAPLHNPSGIAGIESVRELLPHVPNVAVFDTAFHHNVPDVASCYALPAKLSDRLQLRRYGFHGVSYHYVSTRMMLISKSGASGESVSRMIICHLGNGASVCALLNGQSIDMSMGFTPLEGLIMGTRSGDVDPGLVLHLLRREGMTSTQVEELLNHQSGLLGLSELSGDVRDLEKAASGGDVKSQLALECFAYRVRKYIGAYAAALGGLDTLVFTGGIGQYSASTRTRICRGLSFFGLSLDEECNQSATGNESVAINRGDDRKIWIVPTDEERQIVRQVFAFVN